MPNLLHLIWLALRPQWLEIEDFLYTGHGKYVMASFDPLLKAKASQKSKQAEKETFASDVPRNTCSKYFSSFLMCSDFAPARSALRKRGAGIRKYRTSGRIAA
jgi:hypothetical protein